MSELYNYEDEYFDWLYSLVGGADGPCQQYRTLMKVLYKIGFKIYIESDRDRAADGMELRNQFSNTYDINYFIYSDTIKECSVLEMMLALASKIENNIMYDNQKQDSTSAWFIQMLYNLDLLDCDDNHFGNFKLNKILNIVSVLVERKYDFNGYGGLFPLNYPHEDQRNIDIWRQLSAFLYENSYQNTYQNTYQN